MMRTHPYPSSFNSGTFCAPGCVAVPHRSTGRELPTPPARLPAPLTGRCQHGLIAKMHYKEGGRMDGWILKSIVLFLP